MKKVRKKNLTDILQDLKTVYESLNKKQAMIILDEFSVKWKKLYPKIVQSWNDTSSLFTYYDYLSYIRKSVYTTNWMERFNKNVRRLTKTKDSLPNEDALSKLIYYKVVEFNLRWSARKMKGFAQAYHDLQTLFFRKYGK